MNSSLYHNRVWQSLMGLWAGISAAGLCLFCLVVAPFLGSKRAFFSFGRYWVRQQFALSGIRWSTEGWDALPEEIKSGEQPVVFMCNHESLLDPPFLLSAIPIPSVFMAKKEVRYLPGIGWAAWAAGFVFVDRGKSEKAAISLKRAAHSIRSGTNLTIFPEGTRSRNGRLGDFKKGGFFLAIKAGVPIVPMGLQGTLQALPPGRYTLSPSHVRAAFGQPVNPTEFHSRDALIEEVKRRVQALIEGLGVRDKIN